MCRISVKCDDLRMIKESFDNLVILLRDDLVVDVSYAARRGGAIDPEYCVYMTLRYLARYQDICVGCKVSPAAAYYAFEKTMVAIINHPDLALILKKTKEEGPTNAVPFREISLRNNQHLFYQQLFSLPNFVPIGNESCIYDRISTEHQLHWRGSCSSRIRTSDRSHNCRQNSSPWIQLI